MYCKNCNVNFKKDKKVCTRCGAALQPGEAKSDKKKRLRNIIIIASATAVVVVAAFLIIFFVGRVPAELHGTWYEVQGYGYVDFLPNGKLEITAMGSAYPGSYTFNSATDQGSISYEAGDDTFTCDGTTL
jgi:flagellar basal body-associated protein FliL